jgi:hypothetical protein
MYLGNHAVMRGRLQQMVCLCCCVASIGGCAWLKGSKSVASSRASQHQTASIVYQITHGTPTAASQDVRLASYAPSDRNPVAAPESGKTTLAIRYPHPAGLANYARIELIVESPTSTHTGYRKTADDLFDRVRVVASEGLAGLSMAAGIEEARGLDLRVVEFDALIARLRQPPPPPSAIAQGGLLTANIDGVAMPTRVAYVAELDALVLRVRREGTVISRATIPAEFQLARQAAAAWQPAMAMAPEASIQRLPPVFSLTQ